MKFKDGIKLQGASIDTSCHISLIKSVQLGSYKPQLPKLHSISSVPNNQTMRAYMLGGYGCGIPETGGKILELAKSIGKSVNEMITAYGEGVTKDDMHDAMVGYFIDRIAKKECWSEEKLLKERAKLGIPL